LVIDENVVVDDQKEILKQTKQFYEKLYKKQDCLKKVNLSTEIPYNDIPKLTENQKQSLEREISLPELTSALKRMKNNKSPGSDCFTADFFKFFWIEVGKFVFRSVNYEYQQRKMSVTQRQGVITCIPKEGKSKEFLKHWRPITLLNSTYKLASSCIAERIKSVLTHLISTDQTGFIPGRYIGENCRLIYDILHFTEENDIPGILLLIDLKKAFDSISWSFIFDTLKFFNFGESVIEWVKTFYKDITSAVTHHCSLSEFFNVQRGFRQGDPFSPYIFLLCAEILGILVKKSREIKGITIDDTKYRLSQYADDTSLILDGSPASLDASLRLLQFYAEISGLKINLEKTNVIWIGSKKHSHDKMCQVGTEMGLQYI
jgi:mannosylglycoprotein endo-beta-mannosidase